MSDNIVPIGIATRSLVVRTADGAGITLDDAEAMLTAHLGFQSGLMVSEDAFSVTMTYLDGHVPEKRFGLFIVVNDEGYPFLLGGSMTSWGMDVRYNTYINPLLEHDLHPIQCVNVIEIGDDDQRCYQVPLRHCFD